MTAYSVFSVSSVDEEEEREREQAQLLNYLKATGLKRGLLINFGGSRIESKRMVR